jgi:hypothetical protein
MIPLDKDLETLFAADEPDVQHEAFRAAVRHRIATHQFVRTALAVGVVAVAAAGLAGLATFIPGAVLYPVELVTQVLSSPLGAGTAVVGAMGLTCWTTFVEG